MADERSRKGTRYDSPKIQAFVERLYSAHDAALKDALKTARRHGIPSIQVSPTDGKILQTVMTLVGARKVVELGTLTGYSALWLLRGMSKDGRLWTIEADPAHARAAKGVFAKAGVAKCVTVVEGRAIDALPTLESHAPFDAVFLDADKAGYLKYAKWAFANLRQGGVLLADNSYLFGYLAGRESDREWSRAEINAVRAFHRYLAAEWSAVCLPTADGLCLAVKP
ncbi:MAG: O-methyltransferase [Myxococcales bacterium]|nr:MAG: O-methyltransferase [Myxococcales bacterium]